MEYLLHSGSHRRQQNNINRYSGRDKTNVLRIKCNDLKLIEIGTK